MNAETVLDEIKKAKERARKQKNLKFWFVPYAEGNSYFFDVFTKDLRDDINRFLSIHSEKELAKILGNVGGIWDLVIHGLESLEANGTSEEERKQYAYSLLKIMSETKRKDIFLKSRKNIIMSDNEVNGLLSQLEPVDNHNTEILQFCAVLAMYTDALCNHWDCFIKEVHGPYKTREGFLLVRDFTDLRPVDLWPQTKKLQYGRLRVATLFGKTDFDFDIFQHYTHASKGKIDEDLKQYAIIDGMHNLGAEEIKEMSKTLQGITYDIAKAADKMSKKEKVRKYVEQAYYGVKPLREALNKDWRPPKEINQRIKSVK